MNKIVIDNEVSNLDSFNGIIVIKNKTTIDITGKNEIYLFDNGYAITINLLDNAIVKIYMININKTMGTNLVINQNNNTDFKLIDSFKCQSDIKEVINNNIIGSFNKSYVDIRVVQTKGSSSIIEQINVNKESSANEATESLKGLMCGGKITNLPNMEISTNNVLANHYTTLASYDNKELFYLMSKGISKKTAQELIQKGYLYGGIKEKILEVFLNE